MKKLVILSMVVLIILITVTPAFAAGQPPANGSHRRTWRVDFALVGQITALDPEARAVTVLVWRGSQPVKPYFGQELLLQTTEYTRFYLKNLDGSIKIISLDDLAIGQEIGANGIVIDQVWAVKRILVNPDRKWCK